MTRRGIANEPRSVAIYLMRHLRGDSLEEIGREFKIAKYSSVSSVVERIKGMIAKDRKLRKRMVELNEEINMSQEQTPSYESNQQLDRKKKSTKKSQPGILGSVHRGDCPKNVEHAKCGTCLGFMRRNG